MRKFYFRRFMLLRRPVQIEFDSSCITLAKPGDVVLLRLSRDLSPSMRDALACSLKEIANELPGVKFVVAEGVDAVGTSATINGADGSWSIAKSGDFRVRPRDGLLSASRGGPPEEF